MNGLPSRLLPASWLIVTLGGRWLDLASLTWHDGEPAPGPARRAPIAVAHDGRVYVFGGDTRDDARR